MLVVRAVKILFVLGFWTIADASPSVDLSTLLNKLQSMRADFHQTVYDNHGKAVQQSTGKMAMQRPNRFRWQAQKPIPQLIIANGDKLWIYDPDLDQVTIRTIKQAAGDTPALLLSHKATVLDKDFTVTEKPAAKAGWRWFTLVPKSSDNIASVQMGFNNNQIQEMRLQDHLGHLTGIKFSRIETNVSVPSSQFMFKPPANTDVIDETKQQH